LITQQASFIELGGWGGEAWIALHPIGSRKKKAHRSPDSFDRP